MDIPQLTVTAIHSRQKMISDNKGNRRDGINTAAAADCSEHMGTKKYSDHIRKCNPADILKFCPGD